MNETTNEQKKIASPAVDGQRERFITTEEKAQYEVFTNGDLPKETIAKWIKNDLSAAASFIHGCLRDPMIFDALVEVYYKRYKNLHVKEQSNGMDNKPE